MSHYQALELPENATTADIRRAYRRLVLLTHPDRNPDPAAHARYLAINAAYETLSDPVKRQAYDWTLRTPAGTAPEPPKSPGKPRDGRRRPTRPGRAPRSPTPPTVRYAAEYARAFQLGRPLFRGALGLCALLALDWALATEKPETIMSTEILAYQRVLHLTNDGTFLLTDEIPVGTMLLLTRTPLLSTAIEARIPPGKVLIDFDSLYSGASNFFWLGLLASATIALQSRFNREGRLMAGLLSVLFLALTLLRLLHQ